MSRAPAPAANRARQRCRSSRTLRRADWLRPHELSQGGGPAAIERQHGKGRKTARERIAALLDPGAQALELGLWAAYQMYEEWGGAPAAGVVTSIGTVAGRRVMVVANDATVKAGACFPMTIKKILRAQSIAAQNSLPLVYLVDSSGVFLPMQDEVFPDEDDFGRIFRNNCRPLGAGHSAVCGHHGELRGRRGVSAGALRHGPDDRGIRVVSRRPGAREGRHRPGNLARRAGRRPGSFRHQRHRRLSRER